jgi:hypothetical protein
MVATLLALLQLVVVDLNYFGWFPWLPVVADVFHLYLRLVLKAAQLVLLLAVLPSRPASYSAHHITFNITSKALLAILAAHMAPAASVAKASWQPEWLGSVAECAVDALGWACWPFSTAHQPAGLLPLQEAHMCGQLSALSHCLAGVRLFSRCVFILQVFEVLLDTLRMLSEGS